MPLIVCVFVEMGISRPAPSKRSAALILCGILLASAFFTCPSDYARGAVRYARRQSSSPPAGPLAWNASRQLETCETDYRMRGLTADGKYGRRTGYVLCLTYREQQTKAASSMSSLQCWAKSLLVNIVEPFLHDSRLVVPLDASQKAMLAFSDLFSLRQWDGLTTQLGFAPLAPWRQFLSRAPRGLVVVHLQYKTPGNKTRSEGSGDYTEGCLQKSRDRFNEQLAYLAQYGFKVVREVCINFELGEQISQVQFNSHILGPHHPRDVSIVMNEWRGFSPTVNGKRVLINNACHSTIQSSQHLQPSPRIRCEARNYQRMYLGGGQEYISVIVRTEKVRQTVDLEPEMQNCLQKTVELLSSVQNMTNLSATFLSMDIGKYGSYSSANSFKTHNYNDFISSVYGRAVSEGLWEETFERIASTHEAGYVALLQKVLVADAQCMVMVGGGSFQKHAVLLHRLASKRRGRTPCIHIVQSCSKNMNFDVTKL